MHTYDSKTVGSRLSHAQALAFTSPTLALALLVAPVTLLPSIFAKYYGVSLVGLGAVLLFLRAFDSVTDVLIGHFSDRHRLRHGTRKPFVVAGGLLVLPCVYFLVNPPGGEVTVFGFACWSMAFYLAYTLFYIPLYAWAGELTTVPQERTFLFSLLVFVGKIAAVLFFVLPFLPIFETQEITPDVLRLSVVVGACVMIPTLFFLVKYAPNGVPPTTKEAEVKSHTAAFADYLTIFKTNKPFQIFMGAYAFVGLGTGMWGGLFFMFVDVFLGLGEEYATMAIAGIVTGLLLTPVSYKLAIWLGKRISWALSTLLIILGMFYCSTLTPGEAGLSDLIVMKVIFITGGLFLGIVGPIMLNDVADYGSLGMENGGRGVYFALYIFIAKVEIALGVSLGLALTGGLGFVATASEQTADGAFAIRFTMCWLPMAITAIGLYFIYKTPLNEDRMAVIGRRLERRAKYRENRVT